MPILRSRASRGQVDPDLVRKVAVLDEDELRILLDEAQGTSCVPLAELVLEGLAQDIYSLAKRLGDRVVLDDIGRRCCTRDTARELFDEKAEADQRRAEMKARNQANIPSTKPLRQRLQAIQERQEATGDRTLNAEPVSDWHNP